jgi:5-methylcytosine-specific restriction protein A
MPIAPRRPCNRAGCPALIEQGQRFCPAHQQQHRQASEERRTPRLQAGFYSSKEWRRMRAIVLRDEPLCACGQSSDTVDHIIDRRKRPDLALERSNLKGMCSGCHSRKTATDHRFKSLG